MRNYLSAAKVEAQIYSWTNLFSDAYFKRLSTFATLPDQ